MKKIVNMLVIALLFSVSAVNAAELEIGGSSLGGGAEASVQVGGSDISGDADADLEFGGSDLGGSDDDSDDDLEFGGSDLGGDSSDEEVTEDDDNDNGSSSHRSSRNRSRLPSEPTVLGASTGPNGATLSCAPYMIGFSGLGRANVATEVSKLQSFLNEFMGETLPVTGFFGTMTDAAVKRLQAKYSVEILKPWDTAGLSVNLQPTGYAYIMTRWFVNTQICKMSNVIIPKPDLKKEVGA